MSGFVVVVGAEAVPDPSVVRRMLPALSARGDEPWLMPTDGAVLGGTRFDWEAWPAGAEPKPAEASVSVVVDAALYYRSELVRKLACLGIRASPDGPVEELIAAAYRAWGVRLAEQLEGDFSFALFDPKARLLVCARDFCGRRPLYHCRLGAGFGVASTLGSLLAHPDASGELDLAIVAATAAAFFALPEETCYRDVRSLPPGHTLIWRDGSLSIVPHWEPPRIEERMTVPGQTAEEGADQLRELLVAAVAERLDRDRPTGIWLSGGWDSTAVFGAGNLALKRARREPLLQPVSIRYPAGDPGHEDRYVEATTQHWRTEPNWLEISDIPLFDDAEKRAAERDEPFAHVFEGWNRSLARGARATGSRIVLDGVGGDHVFQVSTVYLAELFRRGSWLTLRREWRAKRMRGWRSFARWALLPNLSSRAVGAVTGFRSGGRPRSYLERPLPSWFREDFLRKHGVLERERRNTPRQAGIGPVAYETFWYLTHPFGGRILSCVSGIALQEGVELRSPLMDARVIKFALSRPWPERSFGRETKTLLRRAVSGLVPDEVLAPRKHRTGTTSRYLVDSLHAAGKSMFQVNLDNSLLAALGIVDAESLSTAWREFLRTKDESLAVPLVFTLQTEMWLQSRQESVMSAT